MRILHLTAQLPTRTGSGIYFSNMIKELDKKDDVSQAAIYGTQEPYEFDLTGDDYPVVFKTKELPFPIAGMSDIMPYDNTRYKDMTGEMIDRWKEAFRKRIRKAVDEFRPDIIFSHHLWMLTSLVLEEAGTIPVYGFCHGTDLRQARQNPALFKEYVKGLKGLEKVFALSKLHIPDLIEVYGFDEDKIVVTGAGFSGEIFHNGSVERAPDEIIIVYAGKIAPSKGVYELVKAFKPISDAQSDVFLDLIGAGSFAAKKKLYDMQSKVKRVIVYNAEDQKSLGDFFRRADILVLPSFYEGLGLVALEGLASGLRVVATEIDGLMELLGDEVNSSGVIEYVKMPRIYDTDKPVKEDLPAFRKELTEKLALQIDRVRREVPVDESVKAAIGSHSWEGLAERIYSIVKGD